MDPTITHIDPILNLFPDLQSKFIFTGYTTDPEFEYEEKPRKKQIVASMGAGSFGEELLSAVLNVAPLFPEYEFLFVLGPLTRPTLKAELENQARSLHVSNVSFNFLLAHFTEILSQSALSISLGGAGTFMDLLLTRTPAIVYPHPIPEDQEERAEIFANLNVVTLISREDFKPLRFSQIIQKTLDRPVPNLRIDLDGANNTTTKLQKLLG